MTSRHRWWLLVAGGLLVGVMVAAVTFGGQHERVVRGGEAGRPAPVVAAPDRPELEDHGDHGLRSAETAARAFLRGYLRLAYGKRGVTVADVPKVAPPLAARLGVNPGRVTPQQMNQAAVIDVVSVVGERGSGALATAQIRERPSGSRYILVFHLALDSRSGWLVTAMGAR